MNSINIIQVGSQKRTRVSLDDMAATLTPFAVPETALSSHVIVPQVLMAMAVRVTVSKMFFVFFSVVCFLFF